MNMLLAALAAPETPEKTIRVRAWAQFVRLHVFKVAYHLNLEEKKNANR